MSEKITDMPDATTLEGNELLPLVQGGVNVKTSLNAIGIRAIDSYQQRGTVHGIRLYAAGMPEVGFGFTNLATNPNILVGLPVCIPTGGTIDKLGVYVHTAGAGGTSCRLAIYDAVSSEDLYPDQLLYETAPLVCSASGLKQETLDFDLEPGKLYWVGFNTDSAALFLQSSSAYLHGILGFDTVYQPQCPAWQDSHTYGPMPSPFPSGAQPYSGAGFNFVIVSYHLRARYVVLVDDIFEDADGTLLSAHTIAPVDIPAVSWETQDGDFLIESNELVENVNFYNVSTVDVGEADVKVAILITNHGSSRDPWAGPVVRCSSGTSYWFWGIGSATTMVLYEVNAGVYTLKDTATWPNNLGQEYLVELIASGDTLIGKVDGVQLMRFSGATFNQTATKHGVQGYFATSTYSQSFTRWTVSG